MACIEAAVRPLTRPARSPRAPSSLPPLAAQLLTTRMRVEYLEAPLGVDDPAPRMSWAPISPTRGAAQASFRIVVAVAGGGATVWDSGVVASNSSINVAYGGPVPPSDTDFTWTLVWTDTTGASAPPATATFSTGLLGVADWKGAAWVQGAGGVSAGNMLRAEFSIPGTAQVTRARLYIQGLGYYKSWLNGERTDAHELGSFTTFEKRVLYDAWDVAALLRPGCNALGVMLGAGWYAEPSVNVGPRSLIAMLSVTTADGARSYFASAVAPGAGSLSFVSTAGPVTSDNIYAGENYDARLEQPGFAACGFVPRPENPWQQAVAAPDPRAVHGAAMSWQSPASAPMVDRDYSVTAITTPSDGVFVIDFGQNMAGTTTFRVVCPDGPQWIYMAYGESLHPDGTVLNQYGDIMNSNYTCAGTGDVEEYTTLFSYYGFRYVQVLNFPGTPDEGTFTAHFIHSNVEQTGAFNTDNDLLNNIQHCTRYASLSNLMDVPTDCPQRERRGWLGDAQLSAETTISNFDMAGFYTKWLRDIRDSQEFLNSKGQIPDCVPFYGHGGLPADPAWSAAFPFITNWVSEYYADDRVVAANYDGVKAFMDSQTAQLDPNGVLSFSRYGDWCSVADGAATGVSWNRADISHWHYTRGLDLTAGFAAKLGNAADEAKYSALAATARAKYLSQFYDAVTHTFSDRKDDYPISQMLALDLFGLVPDADRDAVFADLVTLINNGTHSGFPNAPSWGIIGQKVAYDVLTRGGRTDLAIEVQLARGMPSVDFWIEGSGPGTGATTLWENWQSTNFAPQGSYNHIMYGGFGKWLYSGVAGLQRAWNSRGWDRVLIAPAAGAHPNVTSASASIDTLGGLVSVDWTQKASSGGACDVAPENSVAALTCIGAGGKPALFTGVAFASYGTPTGSCPGPFAKGSCDAASSVAVVTAACVGKSSCSVPVNNAAFGGDPCVNTLKHFTASMQGPCAEVKFSLTAQVPTNSVADVVVATLGAGAANAVVYEGNATVWAAGAYVPGTPGITGAEATPDGKDVVVHTQSGRYAFKIVGTV